jgi:rhodanese-related sulfurtransferase
MSSQRQPPPRRTIDDLVAASRARIERFEPAEAHRAAMDGALLIDTRSADDRRASGVIPGSVAVPLSVLYWRLDPVSVSRDPGLADLARHVILVCAHGYSSSIAAATLRDLGFERAADMIGGFEAWAQAGLPIQPAG